MLEAYATDKHSPLLKLEWDRKPASSPLRRSQHNCRDRRLCESIGATTGSHHCQGNANGIDESSHLWNIHSHPSGKPTTTMTVTTSGTAPLDAVAANFQANLGNIIVGTVMTTAGFRIANKVLSKPKARLNKMIRQVGLGATIQI